MDFFDCNVFWGRGARQGYDSPATTGDLLRALDEAGVGRAIAWHIAQYDLSPTIGNGLLSKGIADAERLLGCWAILPPQTGEVIGDGFFESMKSNRIVGLRAFPDTNRFMLDGTVFGKFFGEISDRRIPLFLSLERGVSWASIYQVLKEYSGITCILCDIGTWGSDRYTWPLLDRYEDVYLETSLLSLEAGGLDATARRFGAERLVFGSGYPKRYPEAAMLQLLHADIPEGDRRMIASGNLERLIERMDL